MKVRIPKISKEQKAELQKEFKAQSNDLTRRLFKIFCCALHEEFSFGKERCERLILKVEQLASEHDTDEVFWYHIDREIIDYMGLKFSRENYEQMDR